MYTKRSSELDGGFKLKGLNVQASLPKTQLTVGRLEGKHGPDTAVLQLSVRVSLLKGMGFVYYISEHNY